MTTEQRAKELMQAVVSEVEKKTGKKVKIDGRHWLVVTDEGKAHVNIRAEAHFESIGFNVRSTDRLSVSVDGVYGGRRYHAIVARRSFIEKKKPLDPAKIAAHVINVAKVQARENLIREQKQSGFEKSQASIERLNKKYPETRAMLITTDDGSVRLMVDADEATIEKLLKVLG